MNPREAFPQSIVTCASYRGLGIGDGCGLGLGPWPFLFSGGFVLPYRWFALGAGFGRYVWRRFRLIGRGLGWQRSGSMKPLELARARPAAKFLVRQCSGLSFRRCFPSMRDFFSCFRRIDVPYDLCVGVIRSLLGKDRKPGIVCCRFSAVGDVVSSG